MVRPSFPSASVITARLTIVEQAQSTSPAGMRTVIAPVASSPRRVSPRHRLLVSIASANVRRNNGMLLLGILEYPYVMAIPLVSEKCGQKQMSYILLAAAIPS